MGKLDDMGSIDDRHRRSLDREAPNEPTSGNDLATGAPSEDASSSRIIPKAEAVRLARKIMDENREVLEALAR